jgi:hypothetical protein
MQNHLLRFEYESLMWVALWGAICYDKDGQQRYWKKGAHPLQSWYTGSVSAIRSVKREIIGGLGILLKESLRIEDPRLLLSFLELFTDGYLAVLKKELKDDKPLEHDTSEWVTYCGHVTSDKVREVMKVVGWGTVDISLP